MKHYILIRVELVTAINTWKMKQQQQMFKHKHYKQRYKQTIREKKSVEDR